MPGILLVDEDRLVAEAIANALKDSTKNNPVETVHNLVSALSVFDRLRPEIVFSELQFSKGDAFDLIARLRAENPSCRIVILTANDYDSHVEQTLQAGVQGMVLKTDGLDTLNACIATVRRGEFFFQRRGPLAASPSRRPMAAGLPAIRAGGPALAA